MKPELILYAFLSGGAFHRMWAAGTSLRWWMEHRDNVKLTVTQTGEAANPDAVSTIMRPMWQSFLWNAALTLILAGMALAG